MSTVITINGADSLIEPIRMDITKSDLYSDASTRSAETGDMLLYPIRFNNYSLALEFVGTAAQIKAVNTAITVTDSDGEFSVTFVDETNNEPATTWSKYVTRLMYASDRQLETLGTPSARKYRLTFNLIETKRSSGS